MRLAQRFRCAIASADSRQVYRRFDIGTAKPTAQERAQVPHYLIDICEPTETLTAADYQQRAQALIATLQQGDRLPLLVGGTGLYISAIAKGLKIPKAQPHPNLRQQLSNLGQPHCHAMLCKVDPDAAKRIHPNDVVRTLRALEVFYVTGQTISSQQGQAPPPYPILYLGLRCDPDVLRSRIETRVHQMIEAGLVEEVASIVDDYGADLALLKTLGYKEVLQHLQGEISLDEAIALTVQHTAQFAKRQRTWFNKEPDIEWLSIESLDLDAQVIQRIEKFIATVQTNSAMPAS